MYNVDLDKCEANYQPLTPIQFLHRSADVFPERTAVIYRDRKYTWSEYSERCHKLARALIATGIGRGDTVSIMAANIPAMAEAAFGVPMSGAVLNCINIRLDAASVAFILKHSEAKVFFVDQQFASVAKAAIAQAGLEDVRVIDIADPLIQCPEMVGDIEYEDYIAAAPGDIAIVYPEDEWDAIALNYTSGTTGDPKGVVYHHRGAYLNALGQVINANFLGKVPVYLWTLPLFHCNGWCFAWAVAAIGGTNVCLRKAAAEDIFEAIAAHQVTHFCCAPTILDFMIAGKPDGWKNPAEPVKVLCAGASPPVATLKKSMAIGLDVVHVYGMTEQHGVATICEPQASWAELDPEQQIRQIGRQGVRSVVTDQMAVCSPDTYEEVPRDGSTIGEVMIRGNIAMKGYLKNPKATQAAFRNGWYHTGDLAVVHEDGYIEIKDRSKDLIISGGENISSIEVEDVLYAYPGVVGAAVVAVPDEKWGEVPCAVVELSPAHQAVVTEQDIIEHCRAHLAGFKTPKHVIFEPLIRTATGKLQKFKLRTHATDVVSSRGKPR
ncbi:AMP-binding protein [Castellaniella sp.]|uniref:AMP-binding protein n=1 Tax=Castellaniella sp. TaxID=1955812 RepID=UPI00356AC6AA